jgi:hypothetical protein
VRDEESMRPLSIHERGGEAKQAVVDDGGKAEAADSLPLERSCEALQRLCAVELDVQH